jgi:polysaccharide export outer membrane protein
MSLSPRRFQRCLPLCGWLLAGLLFTGCSHLYYADPNPQTPFVFPGQNPPAVGGVAQGAIAPTGPVLAPVNTGAQPAATAPLTSTANTVSDILNIGDSVTVSFSDIPPPGIVPNTQRIGNDGKISLPYNIKVIAAGKTAGQLQDDIRTNYVPNIFKEMSASVKNEERVFFVEGEVKLASRLPYVGEMTVLRAITSAGGFTDFANRKNIELHRATGQKIIVNWYKAIDDPKLDKPVFPNDQIIVRKKPY